MCVGGLLGGSSRLRGSCPPRINITKTSGDNPSFKKTPQGAVWKHIYIYCNFLHPYFMTHMSGAISGSTLVWCIMIYQLDSMDLFLRSPFAQQKTATGRLFAGPPEMKRQTPRNDATFLRPQPSFGKPRLLFSREKIWKVFENLQWFWINKVKHSFTKFNSIWSSWFTKHHGDFCIPGRVFRIPIWDPTSPYKMYPD